MFITDKVVFLHFPKNGGTFVRHVLRRLHDWRKPDSWKNRFYNRLFSLSRTDDVAELLHKKHGGYYAIPNRHQSKEVFSTIRDPFERYVSLYYFGWWRRYPEEFGMTRTSIRRRFPSYPNLTFQRFIRLCCDDFVYPFGVQQPHQQQLGWYSQRLMADYFEEVDWSWDEGWTCSHEDIAAAMCDVTFLHTERLNCELIKFLKAAGYQRDQLSFIEGAAKVRPSDEVASRESDPKCLFSPELAEYVARKESFFFQVFSEYRRNNALDYTIDGL